MGFRDAVEGGEPMFYVCDHCGHIEAGDAIQDDAKWTCEVCGGHAAWEYPPERRNEAETHAAHIARGHASGIFRGARS